MFKLGDLLIFVTGRHRGFQRFGRHVGFIWEGLVNWSWEPPPPPYLCLSHAWILLQNVYLAKWQKMNLSYVWFKLFKKPFLQPRSYVTSVSRWLKHSAETTPVREDSFKLWVGFSPNILTPHAWTEHHGGKRMFHRTAVHITKDRKKRNGEC